MVTLCSPLLQRLIYGVLKNERHKTTLDNVWKEARVRFSFKSSAGVNTRDVWKWASIIGSQPPWGNNERIYRPWHFSCPWTCSLQICRSIARWNTTWLEVLMITTHTGHIFLAPLSHVNTQRKHRLRHAQLYITVCAVVPWESQRPFSVYQPLIMLMTLCSHSGRFSIDHRDKDQNKVTTLRICACARLKEMKEMWDSTFKLPFIRGDDKGSQYHYPPCHPTVLCGNINMHINT